MAAVPSVQRLQLTPAGHMPHHDQPGTLSPSVRQFLDDARRDALNKPLVSRRSAAVPRHPKVPCGSAIPPVGRAALSLRCRARCAL
jgi:hypothetical protein